jgi:predicted N-acetyltransferase YhbS
MSTKLAIRQAKPDDREQLLPLATSCATSFTVDPQAFRTTFDQCVADDSALVLVAEVDSAVVGYLLGFDHITFFANGRVAGVEELYVEPTHRNQGIGMALMREFEAWARERDAAQVVVCTRRAAGFYTAVGYEETATCFRRGLQ